MIFTRHHDATRNATRNERSSVRQTRRRRLLETLEPRCLLASLGGEVFLDSDGDGVRGPAEVGAPNVRVYLDTNDNQSLDAGETSTTSDSLGAYQFDGLLPGSYVVRILTPGTAQSSPQAFFGTGYPVIGDGSGTNPTQLYEMSLGGDVHVIGAPTTERIHGLVRTNSGDLLGSNFETDGIYRVDPVTGQESLLHLPGVDLVAGLAYDPATDTVYTLAEGASFGFVQLHTVDPNTGQLSAPIGAGLGGLSGVSDLTFDTVGNRIVGFDNDDDEFFSFSTDGFGSSLSVADRPLNSWSLAFDGTSYVMFDQDDPAKQATLTVDPDTGVTSTGFSAGQRIPSEALFHSKIGDVPHRVDLGVSDVTGLGFGILESAPTGGEDEDVRLYLNELLLEPLAGNSDTDQYVEIRGPAGGRIAENTYLVVVDEDNANRGEIHGIFDLSNQPLGTNGFLVLLQQDSPYQVDPQSALLQSDMPGFGGLPGDIFEDSFDPEDRIDSTLGANGFFLIQSTTRPQLGDDIDADNNGFADGGGIKAAWTIHDSVSIHPTSAVSNQAYGSIALQSTSGSPLLRVESGVTVVNGPGSGYAGRIGDSTGSDADDWVFGAATAAVIDPLTGRTTVYELESGIQGLPTPIAFNGRDLDHLGESNFDGAVRGTVTRFPGPGETDPLGAPLTPMPAVGITVIADQNGNGQIDDIRTVVDPNTGIDPANLVAPDGTPIPQVITNVYPGVTITTADANNNILSFPVTADQEQSFFRPRANRIFGHNDLDYFSNNERLRFDLYRPAREVSIEAIGPNLIGFATTFGRLEAYDANDQLIGIATSDLLVGDQRQAITFTSLNEDIAYAVAYSDNRFGGGAGFGRFDNFAFLQSEATAVTDAQGQYEIKNLFPRQNFAATYEVGVLNDSASEGLLGGDAVPIIVSRNENYRVDFDLRPNGTPTTEAEYLFTLPENSPFGTPVGAIEGLDPEGDGVTFSIASGDDLGFQINPFSGVLFVGPGADLNFEATPTLNLTVAVTDSAGASALTDVVVQLEDINEKPIAFPEVFLIAEGTPDGTTVGQIEAIDPDTAQDQTLTYTALGGSGAGVFSVDAGNGLITLIDPAAIDFETTSQLFLFVLIADDASPPGQTLIRQEIGIIDQNDPPVVASDVITVPENSVGVVGAIEIEDADQGQRHSVDLVGGTGFDLFEVTRQGTVIVKEGAALDFESTQSYTLDVVVIDSGRPPLAVEATVTIAIEDVNEAPLLDPQNVSLPENSVTGSLVATLQAVDPEGVGSGYEIAMLSSEDAGHYDFDPATGRLTVALDADLDFESRPVEQLHFEISDPLGIDATVQRTLLVMLGDENDAPTVVTERVIVSELALPGSVVGRVEVQVREVDAGDNVTVAIVGGTAAGLFELDPVSRVLTVADGASFDADVEGPELTLLVEVEDDGGLSSVGEILVSLNDVNEPPQFVGETPVIAPVVSGEPLEVVFPEELIVDPEGRGYALAIFSAGGELPEWLHFDPVARSLTGLPNPDTIGTYPLTLRAFEPGPLELFNEIHFDVVVEQGETPLTNRRDPLDVDANGDVAALDALRVINFMGRHGSGALVADHLTPFAGFVDVSGDAIVTALDALLVINGIKLQGLLGAGGGGGGGTGQSVADADENNDQALVELLQESLLF